MSKKAVTTSRAPAAIGPYQQAVIYDNLIFCSGQIALDPASGELVEGDITAQTEQAMKNLGEILNEAGSHWDNVLKCTIYLADMADFAKVNRIYGSYFPENPPAREAVAVKTLPKEALVEISCMAHR